THVLRSDLMRGNPQFCLGKKMRHDQNYRCQVNIRNSFSLRKHYLAAKFYASKKLRLFIFSVSNYAPPIKWLVPRKSGGKWQV
ncbi:MAG TPA: hypothetical protein PKC70_17465, partial [Cellvibrionaceae bacterium]|nr:hypothetical protein [Cellvibrionaceae bacterium]